MDEIKALQEAITWLESQHMDPKLAEPVETALRVLRDKLTSLQALASDETNRQQRKQVTVLFADVSNFTSMAESMDPEEVSGVIDDLWSRLDQAILDHVRQLATQMGSELHLVHVADGWAARNFDSLQLRESEEMKDDRDYLARLAADLSAQGLTVSTELAMGDPANELIRLADERRVDLLAMSTHGHRFLNDLIRGTTVSCVRHLVKVPVLLVRAAS